MSDTQNKWVPVSERLPEKTVEKLVLLTNGGQCVAFISGVSGGWMAPGIGIITHPTHWMDLPKPPQTPKPADPFEAWYGTQPKNPRWPSPECDLMRNAWNAAKEHYAKPNDYQRGLQDSVIAFESMVDRILEGKEGGTGKLEIPALEKLRRVLLERLEPLPDFEAWWMTIPLREDCEANVRDVGMWFVHMRCARAIWNAAQGKPEA